MQTADETKPAPAPLTTKILLARVNARLSLLRGWLSHDHRDELYWWARGMTAPAAQYERYVLRQVANLLHVERATSRGRIHGTWFESLDEQKEWLASWENHSCCHADRFARLPERSTLVLLRDGKLPL